VRSVRKAAWDCEGISHRSRGRSGDSGKGCRG
jgi:hypothetical protein